MSILTRPPPPRSDLPPDPEAPETPEALIEEARRRTRRRRRGYAAVALVATAAGLLGFYGFNHGGGATLAQDGSEPPSSQATNVFAQVRGWIVYSDPTVQVALPAIYDPEYVGIWAVDPTRPEGDASDRILVRESPGFPLDWSDDGTKLLVYGWTDATRVRFGWRMEAGHLRKAYGWQLQRQDRFFVLNADGSETTVLRTRAPIVGASLSPDGSQMVFARIASRGHLHGPGIYVIETDGGRPHLIKKAGRRQWWGRADGWSRTALYDPVFSPDGTKIAYIDGMGDWGNGLRVMDADGSHVRVLLESDGELSDGILRHCGGPAWSPDGSRLAFCADGGIWVIGADGSGLRKLIPKGEIPNWSPDGSRIAYEVVGPNGPDGLGQLRIADADGKNVQTFTYGGSGPWNPLEPASE